MKHLMNAKELQAHRIRKKHFCAEKIMNVAHYLTWRQCEDKYLKKRSSIVASLINSVFNVLSSLLRTDDLLDKRSVSQLTILIWIWL